MAADQFPFKVLFWFENDSKIITEIKRTDIQSEDKSLVYKWMVIQKENEERISVLTFQSLESSEEKQIRVFAEGKLEWNAEEALFHDEKLESVDTQQIDQKYLQLISEFLVL